MQNTMPMFKTRLGLQMSSNVSVDYLSFSVDLVNRVDELHTAMEATSDALRELLGIIPFEGIFLKPDGWEGCSGQRPYAFGQCNRKVGVFVWFGGHSNALVQFSGQGCKFLQKNDWLTLVMSNAVERLTRLDIAIDVETDTKPLDFVANGYNDRIKTYGEQRSPTGDTCYIGSRKSQKFCRVYRYSDPHPRSHLLRIEYETKKAQAKIAAKSILANGLSYAADSLTKYYNWKSEEMPMHHELVEKMQSEVTDRSSAKTLSWLLKQCAPAFKKLCENGTIENPIEFLEDHFIPEGMSETK